MLEGLSDGSNFEVVEEQSKMSSRQKRALRHLLLHDHLAFTAWAMRNRLGFKILIDKFHRVIADTLDKVIRGEINRLIINISPGYSKTEMAVIAFIARGLAINPSAKFIHLSYSDDLALQNSSYIKETIEADYFQELFPMKLKADSKSKKIWWNKNQGGMMAAAAGGSVTGFRAGQYGSDLFSGAMIIDDPIKPDDAFSKSKREKINNRFMNTFKSRLMEKKVPIIVIMQRIHEDDPTSYLLKGGTGDKWHHLLLPAIMEEDVGEYPKEYTHGIRVEHNLEAGALWPFKQTEEDMITMRQSDPYTAASQYDQSPTPLGGGMFKPDWWKFYDPESKPSFEYKFLTADTAQKTGQENDYSVIQCWGKKGDSIYLIDQVRGKWEAPELEIIAKQFIRNHYGSGAQTVGRLRSLGIEDKSSGTGLIQNLQRWDECNIEIIPIQRNRDKVSRANDFIPFISQGRVLLPEGSHFLGEYLLEFGKFTEIMSHKHDDMIDPTLDAIQMHLAPAKRTSGTW